VPDANGEWRPGAWMTPAIVAASASDTFVTSFPKITRDASATPWMAYEPRWPR
jgi:hypothetical protein